MQSDASLPWLALALTPGLASRLSARVLRRFDSPDGVFRATLPDLESCHLPTQVAKAIVKKESFKRAPEGIDGRLEDCRLLPLELDRARISADTLTIYDPPVLFYVRGDPQVLNLPSLSIAGRRRPTLYGTQMAHRLGRAWPRVVSSSSAEWPAGLMPSGIRERWMSTAERSECWAQASMSVPKGKQKAVRKSVEARREHQRISAAAHTPHRKIFRCEIASSPACRSEWRWWKARSTAGR